MTVDWRHDLCTEATVIVHVQVPGVFVGHTDQGLDAPIVLEDVAGLARLVVAVIGRDLRDLPVDVGELLRAGAREGDVVGAELPDGDGVETGLSGDVVVTRGDGRVERLELATGASDAAIGWSTRPLKGVARLSSGAGFAVLGVEGGLRHLGPDLADLGILSEVSGRRVVALAEGLLVLRYRGPAGLIAFGGGPLRPVAPDGPAWFDVGVDPVGAWGAALDDEGALWMVSGAGEAHVLGRFPDASAVDATAEGGSDLGEPGALVEVGADGAVRRWPHPEGTVVDLAISPDGEWAATGGLDGVVRVWELNTGELSAVLEGHRERVAPLLWATPDSLLSGSWDGTVRRWDLSQLRTPASALVAEVEAAWGMDVAKALEAVGP